MAYIGDLPDLHNKNDDYDTLDGIKIPKQVRVSFSSSSNKKNKKTSKNSHLDLLDDGWQFGDLTKMFLGEAKQGVNNFKNTVVSAPKAVINTGKNILNESEALKDGWQPGDGLKTLGSTLLSAGQNFGEGVIRAGESIIDTGADWFGGASDWVNTKLEKAVGLHEGKTEAEINKQKAESRNKMIATNYTDMLMEAVGKDEEYKDLIESNSLVKTDNMGGAIAQELGRQSLNLLLAKGTGANNKITQSAPMLVGSYGSGIEEAYQNGATTSEARRYGIMNAATETVTEWMTGGIPGLKGTAGAGLDGIASKIIGEGVEESSKKLSKAILKSGYKLVGEGTEEALSEFINPYLKQFTYNYNSDKDVLGNIGEATNNVSFQDIATSFIMGAITAGIIDAPGNISDIAGTLKNNISSNSNTSTNLNEINQNNINNQEIQNSSQNGLNSLNNDIKNNNYQYEQSDNQKINNLNQSASQYFDNSDTTKNLLNTYSKIIQDKNYNIIFDSTITNEKNNIINAQIKTLPNGEIEIRVNPNSDRAGEFLIMHEITHAIENNSMKELVLDYASKNQEFNQALESLKQTYGTTDVSSEVLADISGQLFGNQEFINNLSIEKPNIFKRIYNSIISLANKITGNSKESLFIKDLKNKWEKAYRNQNNNISDTQYMMTGKKGVYNAINNDNNNSWLNDNYNRALELKNQGYTNQEIRQKTGWFQDKYKKWKFEIDDSSAKIIKKLEKNKQYRLDEILFHDDLFTMYPNLKDITVSFENMAAQGGYYHQGKSIRINNSKIDLNNSTESIKKTLLHEIQHAIQREEGFKHGTSVKFGKRRYVKNLGEIEASDTSQRSELAIEKRLQIIPESSKKNPVHPNKDAILSKKRKKQNIEKIGDKLYNVFRGESNEIYEENNNEDSKIISKSNDTMGRVSRRRELENSSFSMQKNDKWKEHLESNYKSTGTKTDMRKIKQGNSAPKLTRRLATELKKETPIKEVNKRKIENNENAIKRLEQEKDALSTRIEEKIKQKQALLNSKQNKDTKIAAQLNMQISMLNNQLQNRKLDFERRIETLKSRNEKMNSKDFKIQEQRLTKKREYIDQAYELTENMVDWKDKSTGLKYQINTMKRNMYDIMSKSDADKMYSTYFQPISENNAKSETFINSYNERIKKLNLNNKESIAVQMLGEYKYNKETLVTGPQVDQYITDNKLDYKKLENAVEEFRNIYDELIVETNKILKEQGYKEIEYRKGYFPHFHEEKPQSKFAKLAEKMGFKIDNNQLPTDIAGMTEIFKPGKTYFKNAQRRLGKTTEYNALKGFDNYIRGAADIIYHTEDIQKLRALETVIRTQYTDDAIRQKIESIANNNEYDQEQKQALIDLEFAKINNPLPNLVTELRNYTDSLANKKDIGDRGMEHMLGRETYTIMKNVQSRVSANMVGFNISSALTNFIPITQAWGQVSTRNMAKAIKESISNQFKNDGFDNCSNFLINRTKKADRLYKTTLDNINDKGGMIFEAIDSITSNTIVRGKYYDNIDAGMSQEQAIKNANEFAKDIMAGRDKGSMPTIFNRKSPLVKLVTAFQLEVNNQYGYMFKDMPRDLGDETKKKLVGAFIKMFIGAWLYNQFSEAITGRKSAFSPIDIVGDSINTVANDNLSVYDKISTISTDLVGEIPFVGGLLGGGRLPIQSAIPNIGTVAESSTQLFNDDTRNKAIKNLTKELSKPIFYVVMPFGGGQLKKTVEGASMYTHDVAGSYTSAGKLRFEAPKNITGIAQSLIFGQYASKNAKEYFDKGYAPLTEKQVNEIKNLNISVSEYREYRKELTELSKIKSDKDSKGNSIKGSSSGKKAFDIMNNDNLSNKAKTYLLDHLSTTTDGESIKTLSKLPKDEEIYQYYYGLTKENRKEFIEDMESYNFTAYQLYDYYQIKKNYDEIYVSSKSKEFVVDYIQEQNLTDEQKYHLYSKNYGSEDTVELLKKFNVKADNYLNTIKYASEVKFNYQGENYSNYRKQKIFSYINSLNATALEKAVLFKQTGYSITKYKNMIYNYIEKLPLSKAEKNTLWNQLY